MRPPDSTLRAAAGDVALFSSVVLGRTLRPYQAEIAAAVLASVRERTGRTFTVVMARQMGKNETSAVIEAYLLNLHRRSGGTVVKGAPTMRPQLYNSRRRLLRMLDNPANRGRAYLEADAVVLGRARCQMLSAAPTSNVVGATADLLLELDEAQDLDDEKVQRDFNPMVASTNATRVLYGTAWDDANPLELHKQHNLELEAADGIRRHFEYPWTVLAESNPDYRRFVEGEIARLGPEHPTIRTQYELKPLDSAGRLFTRPMRELLRGDHAPSDRAQDGAIYVAGVDVAGQDAHVPEGVMALGREKGGRDSTVVTIGRLRWTPEYEPAVDIVAHYAWSGADFASADAAIERLVRETFPCSRVVVDATGLGAGTAARLARRLGERRVEQFLFTGPGKSRLGFTLLAMAGTGRCRMYAAPVGADEEVRAHAARWWREVEAARCEMRRNEQITFGVPALEGHDDYLISTALLCHAAANAPPPPAGAIIPPHPHGEGETRGQAGRPWDEVY